MRFPKSIFLATRVVSIFVLSILAAFSAWAEYVETKLPDTSTVVHYLYKPSDKGVYPAVIVLHHRGGLTDEIVDFTRELSNEKFVTTAVEWQTGTAWPWEKVGAVYDYLQKLPEVDPERIGLLGFSRGALQGAEMAINWQKEKPPIRPIRALVSYYMGRGVVDHGPELPPILFLHGDMDVETVADQVVETCEKLKKVAGFSPQRSIASSQVVASPPFQWNEPRWRAFRNPLSSSSRNSLVGVFLPTPRARAASRTL